MSSAWMLAGVSPGSPVALSLSTLLSKSFRVVPVHRPRSGRRNSSRRLGKIRSHPFGCFEASRGTEYDKTLDQALERQPVMTRPRSDLPDYIRDPQAGKRKSEEPILKSKGNFERLAPEEQSWLDSVTAGHGEVMVRKNYAALAAQAQREKQGAGKKRVR